MSLMTLQAAHERIKKTKEKSPLVVYRTPKDDTVDVKFYNTVKGHADFRRCKDPGSRVLGVFHCRFAPSTTELRIRITSTEGFPMKGVDDQAILSYLAEKGGATCSAIALDMDTSVNLIHSRLHAMSKEVAYDSATGSYKLSAKVKRKNYVRT